MLYEMVKSEWHTRGTLKGNNRKILGGKQESERMYPCKMIWMGVGLPKLKVVFIYSNMCVCVYARAHVCVNLQQLYSIDTPLSD